MCVCVCVCVCVCECVNPNPKLLNSAVFILVMCYIRSMDSNPYHDFESKWIFNQLCVCCVNSTNSIKYGDILEYSVLYCVCRLFWITCLFDCIINIITFNINYIVHSWITRLLFSFAVNALECYMCGSATSNEECNKNLLDCQAPLDTCMTTVATLGERMPLTLSSSTLIWGNLWIHCGSDQIMSWNGKGKNYNNSHLF